LVDAKSTDEYNGLVNAEGYFLFIPTECFDLYLCCNKSVTSLLFKREPLSVFMCIFSSTLLSFGLWTEV